MLPLLRQNLRQDWVVFFRVNCEALFETALLLTANPKEAETSLTEVIWEINPSTPPENDELAHLKDKLAQRAVRTCREAAPAQIAEAGSMLHAGLLPILQIDRCPRICFVLRMLFGYATSVCAQKLGLDEATVIELLKIALLELHRAVSRNRLVESQIDFEVAGSLDFATASGE